MVEEILPNLYRMEIPLAGSPLKALNSYLVKGQGRFLIIDTGWRQEECQRAMASSISKLGVDLEKTDFFITHCHADHVGLVSSLATDTSKVYISRKEVPAPYPEIRWQEIYRVYLAHGFPEAELERALNNHPGRRYAPGRYLELTALEDGETLEVGDYCFTCVETPGHSPGHACLYEVNKKILVSGDHVLFDITPNITFWVDMNNPLKEFFQSLEKVYNMDVNLVLPGHRDIWHSHQQRIIELKQHHQDRLDEVTSALKAGEKTAYGIAPYITWDVDYGSWELFPISQKYFAIGETIAHLNYLEKEGAIAKTVTDNHIEFSLE